MNSGFDLKKYKITLLYRFHTLKFDLFTLLFNVKSLRETTFSR